MAWEIKVLCAILVYMILGCLYRTTLRCWLFGHGRPVRMFIDDGPYKKLVERCWFCGTTGEVRR